MMRLTAVTLVRAIPLMVLALLTVWAIAPTPAAEAAPAPQVVYDEFVYLPFMARSNYINPCSAIPGASYGSVLPIWPPTDRPADNHGDINLALRSYVPTTNYLGLIDVGGDTDIGAPQLHGLFNPARLPTFTRVSQVNSWAWAGPPEPGTRGPPITEPPVTLIWMQTTQGEPIHLPDRDGGNIAGGTNYKVLVLYATTERITLVYTAADTVAWGYAIHIENICVEPSLLALYNSLNAAGRRPLPALAPGQPLGRAITTEIGVVIRDTGTMMDPRVRKDWWKDY